MPNGIPRVFEGISEVIMGVDYRWRRVVFGRRGDPDLYAFGSFGEGPGQWLEPWDIEVSFPYVYITDPWAKRICVWKVIMDTFPNGDYYFNGFSFYKNIGEDVLKFPPPGYFSFPSDVEVDLNGNVYVIDDKGNVYVGWIKRDDKITF